MVSYTAAMRQCISLLSTYRLLLHDAAGLVCGAGTIQILDLGDVVTRQVTGDVPVEWCYALVVLSVFKSSAHPL